MSLPRNNGSFPQQQGRTGGRDQLITERNLDREETVTISKNYLEQLMRESFMQEKLRLASHLAAEIKDQEHLNDVAAPRKHLDLNPSEIPGLGGDQWKEPHSNSILRHKNHDSAAPGAPQLTAQDQWLLDLAAQVEENKRLREREKLEREHGSQVDYFLLQFCNLGARAPIRKETRMN